MLVLLCIICILSVIPSLQIKLTSHLSHWKLHFHVHLPRRLMTEAKFHTDALSHEITTISGIVEWEMHPRDIWLIKLKYHLPLKVSHTTKLISNNRDMWLPVCLPGSGETSSCHWQIHHLLWCHIGLSKQTLSARKINRKCIGFACWLLVITI